MSKHPSTPNGPDNNGYGHPSSNQYTPPLNTPDNQNGHTPGHSVSPPQEHAQSSQHSTQSEDQNHGPRNPPSLPHAAQGSQEGNKGQHMPVPSQNGMQKGNVPSKQDSGAAEQQAPQTPAVSKGGDQGRPAPQPNTMALPLPQPSLISSTFITALHSILPAIPWHLDLIEWLKLARSMPTYHPISRVLSTTTP